MRTLAEQHEPPRSPDMLRVIRVLPEGKGKFLVLSDTHWGCWTHWCGNHTEACFCTDQEREANPRDYKHRWKAFLHVLSSTGRQYFLELTRDAMNAILSKIPEGSTLRGAELTVWRMPAHARGEIHTELHLYPHKADRLPQAKQPRPVLERLWKHKLPAGRNAS
jgi:hypothetical protein